MRACWIFAVAANVVSVLAGADDPAWSQAVERAALHYQSELTAATQELVAARIRVANERLPFDELQRDWQNKIIALEASIARHESEQSEAAARLNQAQAEVEGLNQNLAYLAALGKDGLDGLQEALLPGEAATRAAPIAELAARWDNPANRQDARIAVDAAGLVMQRLREMIGGHATPGAALTAGNNELVPGTLLWVGPEVFFRAHRDGLAGTVRQNEGVTEPMAYPLPPTETAALAAVFAGEPGLLSLDPSGGKALRLREVRGTWIDHIKLGGPIGYIIIALGGFAVLTALVKIFDLRRLGVNPPEQIQTVLASVATGSPAAAQQAIAGLHATCRELFRTGAAHLEQTKEALEESLYATLLRLRMQFERRLAFLTVIVAAAPLLGLLGTVTGMVKTFTLINVFGTGNAAKLSSGISEALVTTELGLIVAIPSLVLHGYLNRKSQRSLALLERYSAEFVAMAAVRRASLPASVSSLP